MFRKMILISALISGVIVSQAALAGPHSNRMLNPQPLPPANEQIDFHI